MSRVDRIVVMSLGLQGAPPVDELGRLLKYIVYAMCMLTCGPL